MLTEKQENFCQEYVRNGFNKTKAYKTAFNSGPNASSAAWQLLRLSKIKDRIKEIEGNYRIVGYQTGINKEVIMDRLKDQLFAKKKVFFNGEEVGENPDNAAINKAIELYLKLVGDFNETEIDSPDKKEPELDARTMTKEEREEYKKKILSQL